MEYQVGEVLSLGVNAQNDKKRLPVGAGNDEGSADDNDGEG